MRKMILMGVIGLGLSISVGAYRILLKNGSVEEKDFLSFLFYGVVFPIIVFGLFSLKDFKK